MEDNEHEGSRERPRDRRQRRRRRLRRPPGLPDSAIRPECLVEAPTTDSDLACPHGVQFYDVVIDGVRHERAAWSYEAPRPAMKQVAGRFGFWKDVEVA